LAAPGNRPCLVPPPILTRSDGPVSRPRESYECPAKAADNPRISSASCCKERILANPFGASKTSRLARDKTTSRAGVSRLSDGTSSIRAGSGRTGFVTPR
jgi:hypothetical protein